MTVASGRAPARIVFLTTAYLGVKWALLARAALAVALGGFVVAHSANAVFLPIDVALWAIADGGVLVYHASDVRDALGAWKLQLAGGVASIVLGAVLLYGDQSAAKTFIAAWAVVWAITAAALMLDTSRLRRTEGATFSGAVAAVLFVIAGGLVALRYSTTGFASLVGLVGAFGVVGGVLMFSEATGMWMFQRRAERAAARFR